jgi:hypothetical protein
MALHALLALVLSMAPQQGVAGFQGNVTKINGAPLQGVRIRLSAASDITTTTDEKGVFSFENLAPGTYPVNVQLSGYVVTGQPPALGAIGTTVGRITLEAGETVRRFHVDMVGTGTISGRVVGPDGKPLPLIIIQGWQRTGVNGQLRLAPFNLPSPARTNDRGEYRVISLPAGEYYLMASVPGTGAGAAVLNSYYPDTTDPQRARSIRVVEGENTANIDFVMQAGSLSITGNVVPPTPQTPFAEMSVLPVPRDPTAALSTGIAFAFDPKSNPPGQFSIRTLSLPPGVYDLFAVLTTVDMDYFGSTPVTIADRPVENIAIPVRPGVEVKGHVTIRGDSTKVKLVDAPINISSTLYNSTTRLNRVRSILTTQAMETARQTREPLTLPREIPPSSPVDSTGYFTLRSVPPGTFGIVPAAPQGTCILDVLQNGKSVLDSGFTVGTNGPAPLEVTISPDCPSVRGVVQSKQEPQRFTRVVLVPTGDRQRSYGLYHTATSDQNGRFSFDNVTPGEYRLFSWESIPDGAWTNAEYLAPYMERGTSVTATNGDVTAEVEFIQ